MRLAFVLASWLSESSLTLLQTRRAHRAGYAAEHDDFEGMLCTLSPLVPCTH